jgi:hypothetical protein
MGGVREEAKKLEEDGGTIAGWCRHGYLTECGGGDSFGGVCEAGRGRECHTLVANSTATKQRQCVTQYPAVAGGGAGGGKKMEEVGGTIAGWCRHGCNTICARWGGMSD